MLPKQKLSELDRKDVIVHKVGTSGNGLRPLHVVQIGGVPDRKARKQPCVVIYAREHPDEHGAGHLAIGVIRSLLQKRRQDPNLRNTTFLVIPTLDPQGTDTSHYLRIDRSFLGSDIGPEQPETQKAYVRWFRNWANSGKRLSLVLNLHNIEGGETDVNFFNGYIPPNDQEFEQTKLFHDQFMNRLENQGYRVSNGFEKGAMIDRFGGFLHRYLGPPHLLYEANSNAETKHLTLLQIYRMGGILAESAADFLHSNRPEAKQLMKRVMEHRRKRHKLHKRYEHILDWRYNERTPVDTEQRMWALPRFERLSKKERDTEGFYQHLYLRVLYRKEGITPSNIPEIKLNSHYNDREN